MVECKNWSSTVGSNEVSYFAARLRQRGCDHGFFVAANGVTGIPEDQTAAHFQLATALANGIRIVVLTREELEDAKTIGREDGTAADLPAAVDRQHRIDTSYEERRRCNAATSMRTRRRCWRL